MGKAVAGGQSRQINVPNGAELRHLLNAAWLARTDPQRNLKIGLERGRKDTSEQA